MIMDLEESMLDIIIFTISCVIAIVGNANYLRRRIKSIKYKDEIYDLCLCIYMTRWCISSMVTRKV